MQKSPGKEGGYPGFESTGDCETSIMSTGNVTQVQNKAVCDLRDWSFLPTDYDCI